MTELRILVAEDMPSEAFLLKYAFESAGLTARLHFVADGQEAMDYLSGVERFSNRHEHPLPTVLMLDLKMPRVNGFEVLQWLRSHPSLQLLPVIIFTSSEHPEDTIEHKRDDENFERVSPAWMQ